MMQGLEKLDHYNVDYDLAMPMSLYLYNYENEDNITNLVSWEPEEKQWWITGFNPEHMFNVDVHKQVMIGCVDFWGEEEKYNQLKELYEVDNERSKYVYFDVNNNNIVWICWYE